jgi:hypothetical protein
LVGLLAGAGVESQLFLRNQSGDQTGKNPEPGPAGGIYQSRDISRTRKLEVPSKKRAPDDTISQLFTGETREKGCGGPWAGAPGWPLRLEGDPPGEVVRPAQGPTHRSGVVPGTQTKCAPNFLYNFHMQKARMEIRKVWENFVGTELSDAGSSVSKNALRQNIWWQHWSLGFGKTFPKDF